MRETMKLTGKERVEELSSTARTGAWILGYTLSWRRSAVLDYQANHLWDTMINCVTEVSSSGLLFFFGVQYYSEDIKHRINNLSHSQKI